MPANSATLRMKLIKHVFKQWAPPVIQPWAARVLRYLRSRRGVSPPDAKIRRFREVHESLNSKEDSGGFVLREGIRFQLHPESIEPFAAFCYIYPEMVEEMDAFLLLTKDRHCLLDVGALHGVFSLAFTAAHPERRALAVDASPFAFARLLYNVHRNAADQVIPVECALSAAPGSLQMHYEWEHAVAAGTASEHSASINVPAERGDDVCSRNLFTPDVIKIDVEGHEISVLRGLSSTIEACHPLIFLEYHPIRVAEEGHSVADLVSLLKGWGYQILQGDGVMVSPSILETCITDQRIVLRAQ